MYDQSEVGKYRILGRGTEFPKICLVHNFYTKNSQKVDRCRMRFNNNRSTELKYPSLDFDNH